LQIEPNLSRLLHRWELLDVIRPHTINCSALSIQRYADDSELAYLPMIGLEKAHGTPNFVAHRADLQDVLKTGAEMVGARIHTDCKVEDINFENASIKISNCPDWIQGDVIIAADGNKSKIRKKMLSLHSKIDKVRETGDAAWKLILSTEQIYSSKDSGLIEALESLVALRWMGPDGHIMCYPIRNHTLLSTLLCTTNMQSM
jgi:salicylate hydroxylase